MKTDFLEVTDNAIVVLSLLADQLPCQPRHFETL